MHKIVYEAILNLHDNKHPFDLASLTNHLRTHGQLDNIGGISELMKMSNVIVHEHQMVHYCRVIEQNRINRELIFLSAQAMSDAYDGTLDIHDTIVGLQNELNRLMLIPFDAFKKPPEMV